jgi:hypothetical protein
LSAAAMGNRNSSITGTAAGATAGVAKKMKT